MNLGLYSYIGAATAYGLFAFLLYFSWRESLQGKLLFVVMIISASWALLSVKISLHDESYLLAYQLFEIFRYIAWYVFLLKLFEVASPDVKQQSNSYKKFIRHTLPQCVGLATLLLINEILAFTYSFPGQYITDIIGKMALSLIGLMLVEQLFRNTSIRYRRATKYLFLGVGVLFAYDFYLYTDALLFRSVDQNLWAVRGIVHMLAVPMLVISSARNKNWSLNIFVSRDIVLSTTAVLGAGLYLLVMASAGYYIKEFGGSWAEVIQVTFFTLAVVLLVVILSSAMLRARIKVFLVKHFYKNKYDYRIEWLKLTEDLNDTVLDKQHYRTAIKSIAHIVDARAGLLWLRDEGGKYQNVDAWQCKGLDNLIEPGSSLIQFLTKKKFVINVNEFETHAGEYSGLLLPEWVLEIERPWLIVPLFGINSTLGFVVLSDPLINRSINWEDHDLLKTAAKQIASYLTVLKTSMQLAEAKQFEVFNRLSAYMVHDLKNIAAELELVAINSKKHAVNPEFIKDAFATIENTAGDINRILEQLRNRSTQKEKKVIVDLVELVQEVVASKQHLLPAPQLHVLSESELVPLEKGRLSNVLAHLIENAQQATEDEGEINLTLSTVDNIRSIEIKDSGCGMSDEFIRYRLFKPFDTTKGNAGMGIGMYESREFIRQLGGDIYVQSQPGKGSIITLHIPLDNSDGSGDNSSDIQP